MTDDEIVTMRPARSGKPLVQFCTYEERQDALKHTSFMADDVSHRASRMINDNFKVISEHKTNNRQLEVGNGGHEVHIPPPPPQFANSPPPAPSPPSAKTPTSSSSSAVEQIKAMPVTAAITTTTATPSSMHKQSPATPVRQTRPLQQQQHQYATPQPTANAPTTPTKTLADKQQKPPVSPVPDYEQIQMRTTLSNGQQQHSNSNRQTIATTNLTNGTNHNHNHHSHNNNNNNNSNNNNTATMQRRTLRLGVLTIGEYDHLARKEPNKFDFLQAQKRPTSNNNISNNNNLNNNAQNGNGSLQAELQHTLQRSNLKKSNHNGIAQMQQQQQQQQLHYQQQQQQQQYATAQQQQQHHQNHCPLQTDYENFDYRGAVNVGNMTRKMQTTTLNGKPATTTMAMSPAVNTTIHNNHSNGNGISTGILKNTNNRHSNGYTKNHEKSISFGN